MKKLLLALAFTFSAIPVQASYSYCVTVYQFAETTMSLRQTHGATLEMQLAVNTTNSELIDSTIRDAYTYGRYYNEYDKMKVSMDFATLYYAKCLDGYI